MTGLIAGAMLPERTNPSPFYMDQPRQSGSVRQVIKSKNKTVLLRGHVDIDVRALGARISQLRELKGLSLGALAEAAGGMAKSYLSKVERGEVENPGLKTLSAIARALDVTVADLLSPAASSSRGKEGDALLAKEATYEQIMANLPPGLADYIQQMKRNGQAVPPEIVKALALVQFRGKRPEKPEDWRFLHDAMMRSIP